MDYLKRIVGRGCERGVSFSPTINPLQKLGVDAALEKTGIVRGPDRTRLAIAFIDEFSKELESGNLADSSKLTEMFQKFRERNPLKENEDSGYLSLGLVWAIAEEMDRLECWKYLGEGGNPDVERDTSTSTLVGLLYEMAEEQKVNPWELKGF